MAGSTKILTVSYGTFSCTLEGFDDSFHSMKAIAEYFRDLAQDDRYFGAEPPAPDAEMLARIAEREISRRVEAQMDGKGIRLRAAMPEQETASIGADTPEAPVAMPPVAEAPAKADSPSSLMPAASLMAAAAEPYIHEEETVEIAEPAIEAVDFGAEAVDLSPIQEDNQPDEAFAKFEEPIAEPEVSAPEVQSEPPAHPDSESVAAKLQRIRAVVGKPSPAVTDDFESMTLEEAITPEADGTVFTDDVSNEDADINETAFEKTAEIETFEVETAITDEDVAPELEVEAEVDSVTDIETAEDEAVAESEPAEVEIEAIEDEQTNASTFETAEFAEPEADAATVTEATTDVTEETVAGIEEDLSADLNDVDLPEAVAVEAPKPSIRARIVRLRKNKPAEVIETPVAEDATSDADMTQRVTAALKVEKPVEDVAIEEIIEDVSIEVTETPHVQEKSDDTPPEQDAVRAAVAAAIPEGSLSDDDEDELQRELAALADDVVTIEDDTPNVHEIIVKDVAEVVGDNIEVEAFEEVAVEEASQFADVTPLEDVAEVEVDDIETVFETPAEEAVTEAAEDLQPLPEVVETRVKTGRHILPEADDAAMSRIAEQTDQALNEPTGSRRRNAIAQLKAAVAATEAARQLGDKSDGEAEAQEAFREDLDQVVRPSRPVTPEENSVRTSRPRTTPLKLVASQRIDDEPADFSDDVQPRRVAKTRAIDPSETGGFAQFAAQMGATELPDLLEAAAAYTSFVEGIEDFSRPQIMKKVQLTTSEEFSREDGLRSFGTLLRQGRISKVRNGRFQISEQTRFRPDARSA